MIYVIQAESGKETDICRQLNEKGSLAYVPRRELILRRNAGWTKVINILFPSYVFIDCDYSPELHHAVKSIEGVIRFLGAPSPIGGNEEEFMRMMFNDGKVIPVSSAEIGTDGSIKILSGFLSGRSHYIKYWNIRQRKALAVIRFGGKNHRVNFGVDFMRNPSAVITRRVR